MALFPRYLVMDPKSLGLSVLNNNKGAQKMCLCHCSTFITSPEVVNSHNMHNNTKACKNNIGFLRGKRGSRLNIGMKALNAKASYATKKSNPFPSANDGNRRSDFLGKILQDGARVLIGKVLVFSMLFWNVPDPALAADPVKTYVCLLTECRAELLHCMGDASCAAYIACIETCNNSPGETECQMKCGDLFENSAVSHLNECALSRKKCVLKKPDDGTFPVPETRAVIENFNIADFNGKWYITSGLNPLFDTFDCQVHEFFPLHDSLTGKWTWRISTPDGGFFTRSTVQVFDQDLQHPGILHYHDTAYLHNEDDWYVVSSKIENKLDDYIFVYYRGTNDAWDGYGGAVIYTRTPVLPSSIVPDLAIAARKVGLDFTKFQNTDNMCGPEPSILVRIQKKIEEGEQVIAKTVEVLKKNLKTKTTLF